MSRLVSCSYARDLVFSIAHMGSLSSVVLAQLNDHKQSIGSNLQSAQNHTTLVRRTILDFVPSPFPLLVNVCVTRQALPILRCNSIISLSPLPSCPFPPLLVLN